MYCQPARGRNDRAGISAFFDELTNMVGYLVACRITGDAAVIGPVLDFDLASASADAILAAIATGGLWLVMVLETHTHAGGAESEGKNRGSNRNRGTYP